MRMLYAAVTHWDSGVKVMETITTEEGIIIIAATLPAPNAHLRAGYVWPTLRERYKTETPSGAFYFLAISSLS